MKNLLLAAILMSVVAGGASAAPALLVFGDSLSAAYGIRHDQGWVTLLQERLHREKFNYRVVNASISGETSSGGAARVGAVLARENPELTILVLGANDGLRGLPTAQLKDNLSSIVQTARAYKTRVLLVGMRVPPNYGSRYMREFEQAFRDLAEEHRLPLVPFLLAGVADRRENFQSDAIHPTAAAQPAILDNVWRHLIPMLRQ